MLTIQLLIDAGAATSKSRKLNRIWLYAHLYNAKVRVGEKGMGPAKILEWIMMELVNFLVFKPPVLKRQARVVALANLMLDVARESQEIGVKLLHGAPKFEGGVLTHDWGAYLSYWLERVCGRRMIANQLEQAYQNWSTARSDRLTSSRFWDFISATMSGEPPTFLEQSARENYRIYRECSQWKMVHSDEVVDTVGKSTESLLAGNVVDTIPDAVIFVANYERQIYIHNTNNTSMNHSCFLAGGAVLAAGLMSFHDGVLRFISPESGHYKPTPQNMLQLVRLIDTEIEPYAAIKPFFEKDIWVYVSDLRKYGEKVLTDTALQARLDLLPRGDFVALTQGSGIPAGYFTPR